MGAYALGARNILCLSGDHQTFGNQPESLNVFDIDSMNLLKAVRDMRENGRDMSGHELQVAPEMFIGAAANPFADPFEYRVIRLGKKIDAGADFIQTQCVYNLKRFKDWMQMAKDEGLTEKTSVLAGVTPLKSAPMAKYMAKKVAGMEIPEEIIKRMEKVPKNKAADEGIAICLETIEQLREIDGVRGIHVMAIEWEEKVREIVERSGLLPRPEPSV
jgi:methylenetetrahydrofolate reductase (NADPH)